MDNNELYEDDSSYEDDEEEGQSEDDEGNFDISQFIDAESDAAEGRGNDGDEEDEFTMNTASSSTIEEGEDPEKLEEKLKTLEEVFSSVCRVLIKRVLCRDDVNGDLNIASQRLQEFQDMDNARDLFKTPTNTTPVAWSDPPGSAKSENKGCEKSEFQGRRGGGGGKKRRKHKNIENQNETQQVQGETENKAFWSRRNFFDKNEPPVTCGSQVFPDCGARQGGRGFRGRARGGWKPRDGFFQDHEYRGDVPQQPGYGFSSDDNMAQSHRGRGNWTGRWNPPKPQAKSRGRGYRGRGENFRGSSPFVQDGGQSQFTQRGRGRYQSGLGRGRGGQGADERRERPVYLADKVMETSYHDLDLGDKEGPGRNRLGQGNRGCSRRYLDKGSDHRGMTRSQSISNLMNNQGNCRRENEGEESMFEPKKLLVCGMSESTTMDGVLNFIEAMSGEEVQNVEMRKGKALVTMTEDITNFRKIREKGEKRGMDSARVTIHRVPECTSILVTGISDDTTHDAIELYFESPRNNGGPVKSVRFKPKSDRAVVVFQSSRGQFARRFPNILARPR